MTNIKCCNLNEMRMSALQIPAPHSPTCTGARGDRQCIDGPSSTARQSWSISGTCRIRDCKMPAAMNNESILKNKKYLTICKVVTLLQFRQCKSAPMYPNIVMVQMLGRAAGEKSSEVILTVIEHVCAGVSILREIVPARKKLQNPKHEIENLTESDSGSRNARHVEADASACAPNQRHWLVWFAKAAETGEHGRYGKARAFADGRVSEKLKHRVFASRIYLFLHVERHIGLPAKYRSVSTQRRATRQHRNMISCERNEHTSIALTAVMRR